MPTRVSFYLFYFVTVRKRSLQRLCFYTCLSVHGRWGGVSRPRPGGEVGGSGQGVPRPRPGGEVGGLVRGVSRSTTGGGVLRPTAEGMSRPSRGGVSQHALRQTPPSRRLLLRVVRILLECILVKYIFQNFAFAILL